jgi:hypothetical protein
VLGFHGCDKEVFEKVIYKKQALTPSKNTYDWLGHGIYFWEHNLERAYDWAVFLSKRPNSSIKNPAVIGAVIDLGYCLNLLDTETIKILQNQFESFKAKMTLLNIPLPENKNTGYNTDLLLRNLDCAVIESLHENRRTLGKEDFDSVRGVFVEGKQIYKDAGFREKTHIQLCIRNPNCIKGYFEPLSKHEKYSMP